jgi:hypothetical protein
LPVAIDFELDIPVYQFSIYIPNLAITKQNNDLNL